jgi:hypothetical protein
MARKQKIVENEKQTLYDLEYGKKTGKRGKWEMHAVGPGIWWENWKTCKMRNAYCRTCNMARKLNNKENEKLTREDLEYGEKHGKTWKIRHAHCRTWNMSRNTENHGKWEMNTVGLGIWREALKIVENKKYTL